MAADETTLPEREVLPTNVKPVHYHISIQTNFSEFTFDGTCRIDLQVNEPTSEICFNTLDIEYKEVKVGARSLDVSNLVHDEKKEMCTVPLGFELSAGQTVTLECKYVGQLNDKMKGYYRSCYKKDGEDAFGGCTQFESTDARRAFPCWDEPNLKSEFTCEVTAESYFTVASNMPVATETKNDDDTTTYLFEKSPVMSSYLVAWVVGEYDFVETTTKRGVVVRCYTPVGKREEGVHANNFAAEVLDWYEEYFQIDYPLPKLDMFAIADFAAGAMENWGLVTYRASRLLVNANTGPRELMFINQVVAHELAHQWFGNLVTMDWWRELWLNEGFANFMESYCSDHLTDFNYKSFFISKSMTKAFALDSMLTSHPIEVPVQTAAQVDEIFDAISYSKGGSVVRMTNSFLGHETFRAGLRTYMQTFKYSNTRTTDLWSELGKASNIDVTAIMTNWTTKQGYPVITATLNDENKLVLRQNRFLATGVVPEAEDQTIWSVPIVALTKNGEKRILLTEREMVVDDLEIGDGWVHLNHGMTGLYLVKYSDVLHERVSAALSEGVLNELDRFQVLHGARTLCKAGYLPITAILSLLPSFKQETSQLVWEAVVESVGSIYSLIKNEPEEEKFDAMMLDLLSVIKEKLGWEPTKGESAENQMLRSDVLKLSANAGDEEVIATGLQKFWAYINEGTDFHSSLRQRIFAIAGKHGGKEVYDALHEKYKTNDDAQEVRNLILGMACNKSPELHAHLLEWTFGEAVRKQDKVFSYVYLSFNRYAMDGTWEYIRDNWQKLYDFYEGGFLVSWLARVPKGYNTNEKADEIENFFATVKESSPTANRAMDQTVEAIRATATWKERDFPKLQEFFGEQN